MNTYGLYVNGRDIQRYVNDYLNYGMDYMGDDNVAADDVCHYSGLPSVSSYSKEKLNITSKAFSTVIGK